MNKKLKINGHLIGHGYPPFVIAEISANHNGSFEIAKEIILKAKESGADAVKLQTFLPESITLNCNKPDFMVDADVWGHKSLFELYEKAYTPREWHKPLFDYARNIGITIFSSPFDEEAVDLLHSLDAPAFKIASFELIDLDLISYAAGKGRPLIMSTGMASLEEIFQAVQTARLAGCEDIALLRCVSEYPASPSDYNLSTMLDMAKKLDVVVGISDHTITNTMAIAAVALGAKIIEKHFTLDRLQGGVDDAFSIEPKEMSELCRDVKVAWESIGSINYGSDLGVQANKKYRRSLYAVADIKKGELFTGDNIRSIRPGYGLPPKMKKEVIGKRAIVDIEYGTPILCEHFN